MTKILIFSDSHGNRNLILDTMKKEKYDISLNLGDHCLPKEFMDNYFNYYVKGNNDIFGDLNKITKIENLNFYLVHGDALNYLFYENKNTFIKEIKKFMEENFIDVFLFGHTHVPFFHYDKKDNKWIINPGSISLPRSYPFKKTYAILNVNKNEIINNSFDEIINFIN